MFRSVVPCMPIVEPKSVRGKVLSVRCTYMVTLTTYWPNCQRENSCAPQANTCSCRHPQTSRSLSAERSAQVVYTHSLLASYAFRLALALRSLKQALIPVLDPIWDLVPAYCP